MIEASLDADKAEDLSIIDLAGKTSIADTMIIASGRSSRQVGAMAQHLVEKLKARGIMPKVEGLNTCDWVLVDAGDVVVHLFRPEVRAFYNLEKMWGAAMPAGAGLMGKPEAPGPQHTYGFGAEGTPPPPAGGAYMRRAAGLTRLGTGPDVVSFNR